MAQYAIISPPLILMKCYGSMMNLKPNFNQFMKKKEGKLYFEQNAAEWKMENARQNISSIMIIRKRLSVNCDNKMTRQ